MTPDIEFLGPTDGTTLCTKITLRVNKIIGDGGRGLSNLEWSLTNSGTILNTTLKNFLLDLVAKANLA